MEVVILQVFVTLMLVVGSVLLFAFTWRQRDFDHADRLALLPIDDDDDAAPAATRTACASPIAFGADAAPEPGTGVADGPGR